MEILERKFLRRIRKPKKYNLTKMCTSSGQTKRYIILLEYYAYRRE